MDRPALRRVLLAQIGTGPAPDLTALDQTAWADLNRIAALHRLQPMLHTRHRTNTAIPTPIAQDWQAAHRHAALRAMVQRAELAETCGLLEREGFAPVALKGAWLAAHAYPDPAQRPMRDIDLLVSPDSVISAFSALLGAGYCQAGASDMALDEVVRLDKHMPPLIAPRGTLIELHHRLWERDGRLDHASPAGDEAAARSNARIGADGLRYLDPQDLLAHLIVHAVYSHRLDCGPLVLSDIDLLLRAAPIDWERFWTDAAAQGWRDGARLLLELTALYCPEVPIDLSPDQGEPAPADLLSAAPDLLLQELDSRASAGLAAATIKAGPVKLAERIAGRRKVKGEAAVIRQSGNAGDALAWAGSRVVRSLRDLAHRDVRDQSRKLAALSKWLDR